MCSKIIEKSQPICVASNNLLNRNSVDPLKIALSYIYLISKKYNNQKVFLGTLKFSFVVKFCIW